MSDDGKLKEIAAAGAAGHPWTGEPWSERAYGTLLPASVSVSTVRSTQGEIELAHLPVRRTSASASPMSARSIIRRATTP